MYNFLSWIERGRRLFYLTDFEVFSERGQMLTDSALARRNDVWDHGVIRTFYGLEGGLECEEVDFWNAARFPHEISEKIERNFFFFWGLMWENGYFQNDHLQYVLTTCPSFLWKNRAFKQLLKQEPDSTTLSSIIRDSRVSEEFKWEAWKAMQEKGIERGFLEWILVGSSVPTRIKNEAENLLRVI